MSSVLADTKTVRATASTSSGGSDDRSNMRGDVALFHRGLADLCRANVPLPRALRILQFDLERGPMAREAAAMAEEIDRGVPLAEAYARREKHFSPVYRALVDAGLSAGGALPEVLEEIAIHASTRAKIVERMRRTLAYPMIAAGFVVVIGTLLVLFVRPGENVMLQSGGSVSPSTYVPLSSALGLLGLAASLALLYTFLRKPIDEGRSPRTLGFTLPLIGAMRLYAAKASFAATMALLLRRHLPLPKALRLTAAATDDQAMKDRVERMAQRAESGSGLSEAVEAGDMISPSLSWLLESSANQNGASDALDDIAAIYRQRLERTAERVAILAAPVAQLLIGLVVLGFALSYMTIAFRMTNVWHS